MAIMQRYEKFGLATKSGVAKMCHEYLYEYEYDYRDL